ncbi:Ionotropic receptor 261 [Frankliniella occidentalis]|nr:Ionotropic receptor 261 [Frankliniella occidentalis]
MTTDRTILSALFLCLAVGEASGNAVTVLSSRVARHPEVPCALTLISPHFQLSDNESPAYAPRLFVFGKAAWMDEFLRRLRSVATIYLFMPTEENLAKFNDFFMAMMMPSASIVLRLTDVGPYTSNTWAPSFPDRVPFILWVSYDSDAKADYAMSSINLVDTCRRFFRVMVTARPRGTTHVFSVPMPCDIARPQALAKAELLGVWSPGAGWSGPEPLLPPRCASWRPPPDGQPLLAEFFEYAGYPVSADYFRRTEAHEVLQLLNHSYGLVFEAEAKYTTQLMAPYSEAGKCRLDALVFRTRAALAVHTHTELSFFPWEHDSLLVFVPAGAGKPPPMYPITDEYTPAVWAALVAVVPAVVACLYLMRRDDTVQELVLQTLSPLLGQPFGGKRAGPRIAVLGGWLLTCLVVVAAYQAQLRGFITVPPQNGEINSWQDWLKSDLLLSTPDGIPVSSVIAMGGLTGLTEDRVIRSSSGMDLYNFFRAHHNVSVSMWKSDFENFIKYKSIQIKELSGVHLFAAPFLHLKSSFVTTKGSPFEVPLRKILGRIRAAGGLRHNWKYNQYPPQRTPYKPIPVINLTPVLAAYIAGNVFAVLTLLLEFSMRKVRICTLKILRARSLVET